nr:hypothetical protein Q903MT_gene673 [Picea sitchensis]
MECRDVKKREMSMKLVQSGKRVSHKAWSFGFYILYKIQGRLNKILKLDQ